MGIHGDVFYEDRIAIPFTSLPPAASNDGRVMRCQPLVAGQKTFQMESDGGVWKPVCGRQLVYLQDAYIAMALNNLNQLLGQIPIPPGLLSHNGAGLYIMGGAERLGGGSDTVSFRGHFGSLGTNGDSLVLGMTLATTSVSGGSTSFIGRESATSIRKRGAAGAYVANALSVISAAATAAATTCANLDTEINYLSMYGQMTTGTVEYGVQEFFSVELIG